jgi:hypothetical protein
MIFEISITFQNVRIGFVPKLVVALVLSHFISIEDEESIPKRKLQKKE